MQLVKHDQQTYLICFSIGIQGQGSGDAFPIDCGKECLSKWMQIPNDTDVLMTHTPPFGFNDLTQHEKHAGCSELLYCVKEIIKPRIHAFGHIHEGIFSRHFIDLFISVTTIFQFILLF